MAETPEATSHVYVRLSANLGDDDELFSSLQQIKDIDLPDRVSENIVNLGSEDREEWRIVFADDEGNFVSFQPAEEEGFLVIDSFFPQDDEEPFVSIVLEGAKACDEVWVRVVNVVTQFEDLGFDDLDLPIEESEDFDIRGVRLGEDSVDFIVQKVQGAVSVAYSRASDQGEAEFQPSFLESHYERVNSFMEKITP